MHHSEVMPSPPLIGTAEAAHLLGVSRSTITRWADTGYLPNAARLDGRTGAYMFERADVERLAQERAA